MSDSNHLWYECELRQSQETLLLLNSICPGLFPSAIQTIREGVEIELQNIRNIKSNIELNYSDDCDNGTSKSKCNADTSNKNFQDEDITNYLVDQNVSKGVVKGGGIIVLASPLLMVDLRQSITSDKVTITDRDDNILSPSPVTDFVDLTTSNTVVRTKSAGITFLPTLSAIRRIALRIASSLSEIAINPLSDSISNSNAPLVSTKNQATDSSNLMHNTVTVGNQRSAESFMIPVPTDSRNSNSTAATSIRNLLLQKKRKSVDTEITKPLTVTIDGFKNDILHKNIEANEAETHEVFKSLDSTIATNLPSQLKSVPSLPDPLIHIAPSSIGSNTSDISVVMLGTGCATPSKHRSNR